MSDLLNLLVTTSDWTSNGLGLLAIYFIKGKHWWAPWLAVFSEVFWFILSVQTGKWGLFVATCLYTALYVWMGINWLKDARRIVPHG